MAASVDAEKPKRRSKKQDDSEEISSPGTKRKRGLQEEEIEVDVSAPEPPSKKAQRKAKKEGSKGAVNGGDSNKKEIAQRAADDDKPGKRSDYGVWIGNLFFSTTKEDLRKFLTSGTEIEDEQITRIHLPGMNEKDGEKQPRNKGFAYVDLQTEDDVQKAIGLSEQLLGGRKVLIKNAKSFEGRPTEHSGARKDGDQAKSKKSPSKAIFVGNLGFDVTKEELNTHYKRCGDLSNIHLATFEDSGKCKGYGWITFRTTEAAEAAVRGWVKVSETKAGAQGDDDEAEDEDGDKKPKKEKTRKWWVNKLRGRELRTEFAEDKTTRYNKRFGKDAKRDDDGSEGKPYKKRRQDTSESQDPDITQNAHQRSERKKEVKQVDARTIKPGAANAKAQRASQAMAKGTGKKITFD